MFHDLRNHHHPLASAETPRTAFRNSSLSTIAVRVVVVGVMFDIPSDNEPRVVSQRTHNVQSL